MKFFINTELFVGLSMILGDLEGSSTIDVDSLGSLVSLITLFQMLLLMIKLITFFETSTVFGDRMILN